MDSRFFVALRCVFLEVEVLIGLLVAIPLGKRVRFPKREIK
jgi:hypothetical protein